ncbi:MAG: hypothetical protein HBSAPP01_15330 [Candidatus Brocadia sapporoensis]|nr:MAG: hypothetical protein HBSAPP01_15330 [Candidatus Brocadia sapporoensis]
MPEPGEPVKDADCQKHGWQNARQFEKGAPLAYETKGEQIGYRCVTHDDNEGNAVNTGDIGDLYYRQILILRVSDEKPWKTRQKK